MHGWLAVCEGKEIFMGILDGALTWGAGKRLPRDQSLTCWTASSTAATPRMTLCRRLATSTPLPLSRYHRVNPVCCAIARCYVQKWQSQGV